MRVLKRLAIWSVIVVFLIPVAIFCLVILVTGGDDDPPSLAIDEIASRDPEMTAVRVTGGGLFLSEWYEDVEVRRRRRGRGRRETTRSIAPLVSAAQAEAWAERLIAGEVGPPAGAVMYVRLTKEERERYLPLASSEHWFEPFEPVGTLSRRAPKDLAEALLAEDGIAADRIVFLKSGEGLFDRTSALGSLVTVGLIAILALFCDRRLRRPSPPTDQIPAPYAHG